MTETKQIKEERWTIFAAVLASSMAFIDSTALNVTIPSIQSSLHATGVEVLWMVNGYLLVLASFILLGGSLGDKLGRKRIFMLGITAFLAASIACGLAPNSLFLIISRLIQGLGGALMIPGSLSLINANIDSERRGQAIGSWSAITTMVMIIGPVLGGMFADAGLWRGIFWMNLPLGLLALWILQRYVPESRHQGEMGRVDIPGALLAVYSLGALTYAFLSMPALGWRAVQIQTTLWSGIAALAGFLAWEAHSRYPMVPFVLFKSRTFTGANLLTLFLYGALSVGMFFLTLELVQAQGYSQSQAGLTFLPSTLLMVGLSPKMGAIVDRYGPRLPLTVGPALTALGFLLLSLVNQTQGPADYWHYFLPGILVFGLGMAITVAPLTTAVMSAVDTAYSGTASGINNAVSRTAGVLAIAIIGALAIQVFVAQLTEQIRPLRLPVGIQEQLQHQTAQLGGAHAPSGLSTKTALLVQQSIRQSFIRACQTVLLICAGLALLSAFMALFLIDGKAMKVLTKNV